MAMTEAQLCNVALVRVGEREFIDSIDENTTPARVCKAVYDKCVNAALARHWWSFATHRATLALTTEERDDWEYAYAAPVKMLEPRFIYPDARLVAAEDRIPFAKELNAAGTGFLILTDKEEATLVYTYKVTNPSLFSPLFAEALSWLLAAEICMGLPNKPQLGLAMQQGYLGALRTAVATDLNIGQPDVPLDGESIRAR